jgi:Protein of unknown function (DUF1475)
MRNALILIFALILACMLYATISAGLEKNLWVAGGTLWPDAWFRATLLDAYCGFLTFYIWVAYKERRLSYRVLWFVLIMALGNIAMSTYVLIQLWRLPANAGLDQVLLRSCQ